MVVVPHVAEHCLGLGGMTVDMAGEDLADALKRNILFCRNLSECFLLPASLYDSCVSVMFFRRAAPAGAFGTKHRSVTRLSRGL